MFKTSIPGSQSSGFPNFLLRDNATLISKSMEESGRDRRDRLTVVACSEFEREFRWWRALLFSCVTPTHIRRTMG